MPWLLALQSLVTLWLAVSCWRYSRQAGENSAALWQAMAAATMRHDALCKAASATFADVGKQMGAIASAQCQPVWPAARCNCKRCQARRQLEAN